VPQGGVTARKKNRVWRIHSAFDLPAERFGHFELTDQHGAERLDRSPVVKGEIRIGDRVYLHPDHMAAILDADADIVVRASWKNARWLDEDGEVLDLPAVLRQNAQGGVIDRPIRLGRKADNPLCLRLVAVKKPPEAAEAAKRKARQAAKRGGHQISKDTLTAAEWVLLVTSLDPQAFSTDDVFALYRLRWRIELGFKRLKSVIGLKGPPGGDERSARPWVLAHLLMILLLEPLVDAFEASPRWAMSA
jgi:IS4 transposase